MNQGIILNGKTISKRERRIIPVKKSLSKKSKKVIEEHLEEVMAMPPLTELTRIGAGDVAGVAWAFLENGSRELVGVSLGNRESYNAWKDFLVWRGMGEPMLTTIDGCPGLIKAVDEVFP